LILEPADFDSKIKFGYAGDLRDFLIAPIRQIRVPTVVGDTLTMFFNIEKIFSCNETIFSVAETRVEVPAKMVPAVETLVWTIKTIVFIVETRVCGTKTLFSEAEPIFCASETGFSITKKSVGEVPGGVRLTTPQFIQSLQPLRHLSEPRSLSKYIFDILLSPESGFGL
jgi:hypothetical protein